MANPNIRVSKELRVLDFVQGSNLRQGLRQGNKGKRVKEGPRIQGFQKSLCIFILLLPLRHQQAQCSHAAPRWKSDCSGEKLGAYIIRFVEFCCCLSVWDRFRLGSPLTHDSPPASAS